MVSISQAAINGQGVYTAAEAARLARMPLSTLSQWFWGSSTRPAMRPAGIQDSERRAITFIDFVEALAIRSLRADHQVSFQKIREAVVTAEKTFGIQHPFAHRKHRTVVAGKDIHIFLEDDPKNPVGLTGRDKLQKSFAACIEPYMADLDFDATGMARRYKAFKSDGIEIVMDPKIRFGQPTISGYGVTAETLYRAVLAEGGIEEAAEAYEIPAEAVRIAYRYWNDLRGLAA